MLSNLLVVLPNDMGLETLMLAGVLVGLVLDTGHHERFAASVAVNGRASLSTNLLVTVPPPPEGTRWEIDSYDPPGPEPGMVAAVFDPATGAVTEAARTPGLAAARVGITLHETDGGVETRLTIAPYSSSSPRTMPPGGPSSRRRIRIIHIRTTSRRTRSRSTNWCPDPPGGVPR